jgi:hypothetical protein
MRSLLLLFAAAMVLGLGFWAYRENYATQQALRNQAALQREVAQLREAIAVHRAELAYLSRPDRLSELVLVNFAQLKLLPMRPEQFAAIEDIAFPPPPDPLAEADPGLASPVTDDALADAAPADDTTAGELVDP